MLLALHLEVGQLLPEPCIFRLEVDRLLEPGLGLGELPVDPQGHADLQVAVSQVGIQPKRFQIGAARLFPTVELLQGVAQIVMMDRQIRLEPDGLLAVDQGFLGLTAVEEDQAEPAPGRRVPGRQLDGAAQVLERFVVLGRALAAPSPGRGAPERNWAAARGRAESERPPHQDGPKPGSPDRACTGPRDSQD